MSSRPRVVRLLPEEPGVCRFRGGAGDEFRNRSAGSGSSKDSLLRVVAADLEAYRDLEDDVLAALPGVQRLTTTLVMKHVVADRPYPAGSVHRRSEPEPSGWAPAASPR